MDSLAKQTRPFRAHTLTFHIMVFYHEIFTSECVHWVDGAPYQLSAGDFVSVAPGQVHSFPASETSRATIVAFTEATLDTARVFEGSLTGVALFSPWLNSPLGRFSQKDSEVAQALVQLLVSEVNAKSASHGHEILLHIFTALALVCLRNREVVASAGLDTTIRFLRLVTQKCRSNRSVSSYQAWLGVSPRQLLRVCRTHLGRSPKSVIDEVTVLEIKRAIVLDKATNKDLCSEFDFTDQSSLARYFRRHTNLTPSEWSRTIATEWAREHHRSKSS